MNSSRLRVALYLLLVFVSGVVVGALGHRFWALQQVEARPRNPQEFRRRYVEEMRTRLQLTEEQLRKLNAILDVTDARFRQVRERMRPEMNAIQEEHANQVRAILTDEQRQEYEKLRAEMERKRKKNGHPRGLRP
ncbi:MAG: hypothetical protein RMK57_00050 [Bryobacterales bacterium]|nr:hypothetical protein [Bryobacteraceae bacterium]MDW8352897.1 hypothetical protein [Bryobacterales bacterium]